MAERRWSQELAKGGWQRTCKEWGTCWGKRGQT